MSKHEKMDTYNQNTIRNLKEFKKFSSEYDCVSFGKYF